VTAGILLSGGMDSTALAYRCRPDVAFTVDYGQRSADGEIRAAREVAILIGMRHETIRVDCSSLGSGDLAGKAALPIAPVTEWWPFRNQLLVTLAAMRGVALGVDRLLIGTVASDGAHADGRREFLARLDELVCMQEGAMRVEAPAAALTSANLIRYSGIPRSILCWAHSCHTDSVACGYCRGCNKHREVMSELFGPDNAY
jgi:7-cyano-7-deazaguanine synthase